MVHFRDFPDGPVVKTPCSQCREHGFDPWSGKKDSECHIVQPQKKVHFSDCKTEKYLTVLTTIRMCAHPIISKQIRGLWLVQG